MVINPEIILRPLAVEPEPVRGHPAKHQLWKMADAGFTEVRAQELQWAIRMP
jgi:hypothetical protein